MKIFVFFLVIFAILLSILARRILKDSNDRLDEFYKNSSKKAPIHLRRYLQTLGLEELPQELSELTKVYRQLAKDFHPDSPNGNEIEFIKINKAYEILKETYQSEKASSKS